MSYKCQTFSRCLGCNECSASSCQGKSDTSGIFSLSSFLSFMVCFTLGLELIRTWLGLGLGDLGTKGLGFRLTIDKPQDKNLTLKVKVYLLLAEEMEMQQCGHQSFGTHGVLRATIFFSKLRTKGDNGSIN